MFNRTLKVRFACTISLLLTLVVAFPTKTSMASNSSSSNSTADCCDCVVAQTVAVAAMAVQEVECNISISSAACRDATANAVQAVLAMVDACPVR